MKKSLLSLILATVALSLVGVFVPQVQALLALSWAGLKHHYYWQLLTYVFVEPGPIAFTYLLQLAFNMYLLWLFGSSLIERSGLPLFLALYFGSALLAGLPIFAFPHAALAGPTPAVYALLTAWMMLNQGTQLLLFFILPFKSQWLVVALLGFTLFIALSNSDWLSASTLLISILYGYLFALVAWRVQGPFAILRPFERRLLRFLEKKKNSYNPSKIYDIRSGKPLLDDEQFMDAMLDRISRHGEDSLTSAEKKRMQAISARKNSTK